jgi:hypothetical protein
MENRRKKLDAFVSFELRAMSKGQPNTEKLRFFPLGIHQCLQRWLGIYNLFFDLDRQRPKSLKKAGDQFIGNLKAFLEDGNKIDVSMLALANEFIKEVEHWNPLPISGTDHIARRRKSTLVFFRAQIYYFYLNATMKAPECRDNSSLIDSQHNINGSFYRCFRAIEEEHSRFLADYTDLIAETHIYLTAMELVSCMFQTGDFRLDRDRNFIDFLQAYPFYLTGRSANGFMEMLRKQCFDFNRKAGFRRQKSRREHPNMVAISECILDLPPGIRDRRNARLPLEVPIVILLMDMIVSGDLWKADFQHKVVQKLRSPYISAIEDSIEGIIKQIERIRTLYGRRIRKIVESDPQNLGYKAINEIFDVIIESGAGHPISYLAVRKSIYRCTLPMFSEYSNLPHGVLKFYPNEPWPIHNILQGRFSTVVAH